MKISGFTFIKNALIYDYPIVEAIQSILPICDEFVVAIGKSEDATLELIRSIPSDKIKIMETTWNEKLRKRGRTLAMEADKAFAAIAQDSDWAFYIQGDEVVHEKYLETIYKAMEKYKNQPAIDGLLFKYLHFYGSYDYVGDSAEWYEHEIRVVKNNPRIFAYRDAQGFRKNDNEKLVVKPIDAYIYHYGWVKKPEAMQKKTENFPKFYHEDEWLEKNVIPSDKFDYDNHLSALRKFEGSHPKVMQKRIADKNWYFETDISRQQKSIKKSVKNFFKKRLGLDFSYKNYIVKSD